MRKQRYGNIVLMGSDQVFIGKGSSAVYGLSKAALGQLTKSTAIDYAPYNVRVNCICPGTIDTPMLEPSIQRFHEVSGMPIEAIFDSLRKAQPIQRLGTTEEIRLESADRAAGYWTTRSDSHPQVNARTSGIHLRADPDDMSILDGRDDRRRVELIAERLAHWMSA